MDPTYFPFANAVWWVTAFNFVVVPTASAIGMYFLAPRLNASRPLWVVLALIPYVNQIFQIYVIFKVLFRVLDSFAEIKAMLAPGGVSAAGEGEAR